MSKFKVSHTTKLAQHDVIHFLEYARGEEYDSREK